jgi:MarR family
VEALRDCVALMLAQGEVRPVRSLAAAALARRGRWLRQGGRPRRSHRPSANTRLLAEMVCSARETVTRAVDELEREGFVIREAGGYRVAVDAQLPCENSHGAARRAFLRSVRG